MLISVTSSSYLHDYHNLAPPSNAGEFDDILDSSNSKGLSDSLEEISLTFSNTISSPVFESNGSMPTEESRKLLNVENLTLQTPTSKATLVRDLSLEINEKEHLLVGKLFHILVALTLHEIISLLGLKLFTL